MKKIIGVIITFLILSTASLGLDYYYGYAMDAEEEVLPIDYISKAYDIPTQSIPAYDSRIRSNPQALWNRYSFSSAFIEGPTYWGNLPVAERFRARVAPTYFDDLVYEANLPLYGYDYYHPIHQRSRLAQREYVTPYKMSIEPTGYFPQRTGRFLIEDQIPCVEAMRGPKFAPGNKFMMKVRSADANIISAICPSAGVRKQIICSKGVNALGTPLFVHVECVYDLNTQATGLKFTDIDATQINPEAIKTLSTRIRAIKLYGGSYNT